jgi:hypothetical protein
MDWSETIRRVAAFADVAGYITFDQFFKLIPSDVAPQDIEGLMEELKAKGIEIVEDKASANSELTCSFCGKDQSKVLQLIAGPSVFICNECVQLCVGIVATQNPDWLEPHRQFLTTLPLKPKD